MKLEWDAVVIGGGFFGCALSVHLRELGYSVLLCEREQNLLQRASYHNQARVHHGYHYPRSILTALRSSVNFPRFIADFPACIDSSFDHYYAIPRSGSKVSARQFRLFMDRTGAPISPAPPAIQKMFNSNLIEEVFLVREYAFDAVRLGDEMRSRMDIAGVESWCSTEVRKVEKQSGENGKNAKGAISVSIGRKGERFRVAAGLVFNCAYSNLNLLLHDSGLPRLSLKQEITEMALVEQPEELQNKAVTVMCGAFFSTMPFPSLGQHTLSHVRYTPHCSWMEGPGSEYRSAYDLFACYPRQSRFEHMRQDAARYLPALGRARQKGSLWEVKTVLPRSEVDDSRPILFRQIQELQGLFCIMGGKIDNIYDVFEELPGAGILKL